jgi:hypothetical protein
LVNQESGSIAVGPYAGCFQQGTGSVAIGYQAGCTGQAPYSIAIGYQSALNEGISSYSTDGNTGNTYLGAYTSCSTSGGPFTNSTAVGINAQITSSNQIVLGTSSSTIGNSTSVQIPGFLQSNSIIGAIMFDLILSSGGTSQYTVPTGFFSTSVPDLSKYYYYDNTGLNSYITTGANGEGDSDYNTGSTSIMVTSENDDYWLVMPNFGIIVYNTTASTTSPYSYPESSYITLNVWNRSPWPIVFAPTTLNVAKSVALYFNGKPIPDYNGQPTS